MEGLLSTGPTPSSLIYDKILQKWNIPINLKKLFSKVIRFLFLELYVGLSVIGATSRTRQEVQCRHGICHGRTDLVRV